MPFKARLVFERNVTRCARDDRLRVNTRLMLKCAQVIRHEARALQDRAYVQASGKCCRGSHGRIERSSDGYRHRGSAVAENLRTCSSGCIDGIVSFGELSSSAR